jgi:hypothetical protein
MTPIPFSRRAVPKWWAGGDGDRETTQVSVAEPRVHGASFAPASHHFINARHFHYQGPISGCSTNRLSLFTPPVIFIIIIMCSSCPNVSKEHFMGPPMPVCRGFS